MSSLSTVDCVSTKHNLTAVDYFNLLIKLKPNDLMFCFWEYFPTIKDAELQEDYSKPMPWIGMYIVLASLVCILAMVTDLLQGLKSRKLWFPCKYFTLNAASLTVIGVAIKLPMDLNNSMPGEVDQAAKLGSLAFMCTMMVNSLPSLATMESKQLVENVMALGVLLITLVVNVCIQISTGVVSDPKLKTLQDSNPELLRLLLTENNDTLSSELYSYAFVDQNQVAAALYVAMLLVLLIIYTCSALGIMESKRILESKYEEANQIALEDQEHQSTVEKLKRHISKHWIMAGTGSPQFMTVCSPTTSASGVICALSAILLCIVMIFTINSEAKFHSDYEWSVPVILITQSIGVILGTIAPLCRCFASLSFKVSIKWLWDHIKVFKVESYWTQKLCVWKQSCIAFQFRSRIFKSVIEKPRLPFLSFCIGFQKTVVVACKMIALLPIFFSALVIVLFNKSKYQRLDKKLSEYVLKFQDDMEPAERTLKRILKSMNRTIQKAEKRRPKNLKELLLEESRKGVETFDSHRVSPLLQEEFLNCWSLELVTLATILRSLPKNNVKISSLSKNKVKTLLKSVSEGLGYVTLVDEWRNTTHEYVSIKAAKLLWLEVEIRHKWLGKKVKDLASQLKTTEHILEWFRDTSEDVLNPAKEGKVPASQANTTERICERTKDTSENVLTLVKGIDIERSNENEGSNEIINCKRICAKSMNGITRILLSYQDNSEEVIIDRLSSMISHSLATSLTNLPQVIEMKCQTNVIDKREESVDAAAKLLGETAEIINILVDHELPRLSSDKCTSEAPRRKCF